MRPWLGSLYPLSLSFGFSRHPSLALPLSLVSRSARSARGYKQDKLTENVQCEIMQVVLEEARESYALEIVQECPSNTLEDMTSNVSRMQLWLEAWLADKAEE